MTFGHLTREYDVRFCSGLPSTNGFKMLFEHLMEKASVMHHWRGEKDARKKYTSALRKSQAQRALKMEQEFLLCMMRLKQSFPVDDLAFRFGCCATTVSSVFTTWLKMMAKGLG